MRAVARGLPLDPDDKKCSEQKEKYGHFFWLFQSDFLLSIQLLSYIVIYLMPELMFRVQP
jgi:hypothetical protein